MAHVCLADHAGPAVPWNACLGGDHGGAHPDSAGYDRGEQRNPGLAHRPCSHGGIGHFDRG